VIDRRLGRGDLGKAVVFVVGPCSSLRLGGDAPLTHLAIRAFHVNFFITSIYLLGHKYTPFSEIPAYALNKLYEHMNFVKKTLLCLIKIFRGILFLGP